MGNCCSAPHQNRVAPDSSSSNFEPEAVVSLETKAPQATWLCGLCQQKHNKVSPASGISPFDTVEQLGAVASAASNVQPVVLTAVEQPAPEGGPFQELQTLVQLFLAGEGALRTERAQQVLASISSVKANLPRVEADVGSAMTSVADSVHQLLVHTTQLVAMQFSQQSDTDTSWATATPQDLVRQLQETYSTYWQQDTDSARSITAELLSLLHNLHSLQHAPSWRQAGKTTVAAINQTMSMFAVIFFRKVVVANQEELERYLGFIAEWQQYMGWTNDQLAVALDPSSKAMLVYLEQAAPRGEKRLELTVHRSSTFWDAAAQAHQKGIVHASPPLHCHKLFPSFVDEHLASGHSRQAVEAGEGHGPRKEFFMLAGSALNGAGAPGQAERSHPQLFNFNRSAGTCWFNSRLMSSPDLQHQFWFAGWLVGQCIFNRAAMGCSLAPLIFERILNPDWKPTISDLEAFDPDAAQTVRRTAELPPADFAAVLELEELPGTSSREAYADHAVQLLLVESVAWQFEKFKAGFLHAVDIQVLQHWQVTATDLAVMVRGSGEGQDEYDLAQVFRLVIDTELQEAGGNPLGRTLLQVFNSWPVDRRRQFLKFVTGTDRLPLPGTELLHVVAPFVAFGVAEQQQQLGMLPQAHTCDNTLELPNYWESLLAVRKLGAAGSLTPDQRAELEIEVARILDDRLTVAITMYDGYGLDEQNT